MEVRRKKPIPMEKKKGVVNEVPCKDCSMTYIRETGGTVKKRMTEHKNAVRKGDTENGIAVHVNTTLHAMDWEVAILLDEEQVGQTERVKEAIHIKDRISKGQNISLVLTLLPR